MRRLTLLVAMLLGTVSLYAQQPLYVVNGQIVDGIDNIPHEAIERIDVLPADEQTIAEWGIEASEGVIIVRLRYDQEATFHHEGFSSFTDYLASAVRWDDSMPPERVSLRIVVDAQGSAFVSEVLESTSRQFLKRVERAIEEAPKWQPAMRDGKAIESVHLVNLLLPKGKELPEEHIVIIL